MTIIRGKSKSDTLTDKSGDARSEIYGFDGNDTLNGNSGIDHLYGGLGNDILYGGVGDDWLYGGSGADFMDGGAGEDGVSFIDVSFSVTFSLDGSLKATGAAIGDRLVSIENLGGSENSDKLAGNSQANRIFGEGGNDTIFGRGGDDVIYGGASSFNRLYGESGNDWIVYEGQYDIIDGGGGTDGVSYINAAVNSTVGGIQLSLDEIVNGQRGIIFERLFSIENVEGSQRSDQIFGNSGNNSIWGIGGADKLYGRAGNDFLYGGNNQDRLFGDSGDDLLNGEAGSDLLDGGEGEDTASYYYGKAVRVSLDGSVVASGDAIGDSFISIEDLEGSSTGSDILAGNEVDNTIWAYGGNDQAYGRAGADKLFGHEGNDQLYGGDDSDILYGGAGQDFLDGGDGIDNASYYYSKTGVTVSLDGSLKAAGEAIGDRFVSIEDLEGSNGGADILSGNSVDNSIYGYAGMDTIYGRAGDDFIDGGFGNDRLFGGYGDDDIEAGNGADYVDGGNGSDYVGYINSKGTVSASLDGSLRATGDAIGDVYVSIENLAGSRVGNDSLAGNAGNNELWGSGGNDWLWGRAGDDVLYGNDGADTLRGEAGNDTFAFKFVTEGGDRIMDFAEGDMVGIRVANFGDLVIGDLAEIQFDRGPGHVSESAEVRFLFDETDDTLWYDSDGSGSAEAVLLATLTNGFTLSHLDFVLMGEP